ncbi:hypothetical protein [Streptomyces sp. NPDC048639]|uniref:hypothetical protein n=1 Tax=Streptomyces sp. NPDC048639 TaxID=3365581 RepID=UPI003723E735
MGWTVLYIAFGVVALWLLGEVLLQYKARLRWRLLAFVGFLGVVIGVLTQSVVVIGAGAAAFAVGQTYVTLSFRRGFSTGWALRNGIVENRRRKDEEEDVAEYADPTLEVSGLEAPGDEQYQQQYQPYEQYQQEAGQDPRDVYQPQPMPDDTGQYGIYSDAAYDGLGAGQDNRGAYAATSAYATTPAYGDYGQQQDPLGDPGSYAAAGQYDYGTGQYQAYTDPYPGTDTGAQNYDPYASYGGQGYDYGQYADPYGTNSQGQYGDTPPGGVWAPQQGTGDQQQPGELPDEQAYPYQQGYGNGYGNGNGNGYSNGNGNGYDDQYRY